MTLGNVYNAFYKGSLSRELQKKKEKTVNLTRNLSRHVKENITSSYQKQETSYDDVITLKRKWLTILKGFFSQACIYNLLKHTGAEQLLLGWSETASIRESIPSSPVCSNIYILSSVCTSLIRQGFALNPVYEYFITQIVKIRTLFRINKQHFIALGWRNPLIFLSAGVMWGSWLFYSDCAGEVF